MPWIAAGAAIGGGLYGAHKEKGIADKQKEAYKLAIKKQIRMWKKAYEKSKGEFAAAKQGILDREQQQYGGLTAGMASGGLLGTTVAPNMARGVKSDTNRALLDLASARASSEYGKWMNLGEIKGQWSGIHGGGFQPGTISTGWAQTGALLGNQLGKVDWSNLFGKD